MQKKEIAGVILALLVSVSSCQDGVTTPRMASGRPSILDGAHNNGNPHFYFLPPLVKQPQYSGIYDPSYSPVVRICEWTGTQCVTPAVAEFSKSTGDNSQGISVAGDHYAIDWHTNDFALDPTKSYRIIVLVGRTEIGHADIAMVSNGREVKNIQTDELIALVDGRTVPIVFRLEKELLCGDDASCFEGPVGPDGGTILHPSGVAGVEFPAGSLETTIHVAIRHQDPGHCLPPTSMLSGECFEFITDQPAGFTLLAPATIGICAEAAEAGADPILAKVEAEDASQTAVNLERAPAGFLSCTDPAKPVGGSTTSFSYVAPTIFGVWEEIAGLPARARSAVTALDVPRDASWFPPRDATAILTTGGLSPTLSAIGQAEYRNVASSPNILRFASLNLPRWGHTATRLADGRVLLTGGVANASSDPIADAEIASGGTVFAPTGEMRIPRAFHTATLLPSGKVLIVGGFSTPGTPALTSAELYDPATGAFSFVGSLNQRRERHTATLLPTPNPFGPGAVLIAGGDPGALPNQPSILGPTLASMEVFNPSTNQFTLVGNLLVPRRSHTATYLPVSQAILIAGGTEGRAVHATADIVTMTSSPIRSVKLVPLAVGVFDQTAQLTEGRNVLLVGGDTDPNRGHATGATQWLYDAGALNVVAYIAPSLHAEREGHASAHIVGNRVFVVGGIAGLANSPTFLTTAEVFSFR